MLLSEKSDYLVITFEAKSCHAIRKFEPNKPNYFKIDYDQLNNELLEWKWEAVINKEIDACDGYKYLNEVMKSSIDKHTPSTKVKAKRGAPWCNRWITLVNRGK